MSISMQFYQLAKKEIAALIVADEHPNIVRCFAMEECSEFVYLALERCKQSLNDMLGDLTAEKSLQFCGSDGEPTDLCLKVRPYIVFMCIGKNFMPCSWYINDNKINSTGHFMSIAQLRRTLFSSIFVAAHRGKRERF